jgi:hypothetical protein
MSNTNMTNNDTTITTTKPLVLRQDTLAVTATVSAWCRYRTVHHAKLSEALAAQKDSDRVSGRVIIAKSFILDDLEAILRKARAQIKAYCVPAESLKLWLARQTAVPTINQIAQEANATVQQKVAMLQSAWADIIQAAQLPIDQGGLGNLFDPAWYPKSDSLPALWGINVQCIPITVTTEAAEQLAKEAKAALRQEFYATVKTICAKLLENQRLRANTFEPLRAFIKTFSARDVAGDSELAELLQQANAIANSPAALAVKGTDQDLRQYLAEQMNKLADLASTITPERSFD